MVNEYIITSLLSLLHHQSAGNMPSLTDEHEKALLYTFSPNRDKSDS